jgi:hypothetical protein
MQQKKQLTEASPNSEAFPDMFRDAFDMEDDDLAEENEKEGENKAKEEEPPEDGCNYYFKFSPDLKSPYVGFIRSNLDPNVWVPFTMEDYKRKFVVRPMMGGHEMIQFEDCGPGLPPLKWHWHYFGLGYKRFKGTGGKKRKNNSRNYEPIIDNYTLPGGVDYIVKFKTFPVPDWIIIEDVSKEKPTIIFDSSDDEMLKNIDPALANSRLDKKYKEEYEALKPLYEAAEKKYLKEQAKLDPLLKDIKTAEEDVEKEAKDLKKPKRKMKRLRFRKKYFAWGKKSKRRINTKIKDLNESMSTDRDELSAAIADRKKAKDDARATKIKFNDAKRDYLKLKKDYEKALENYEKTKDTGFFLTPNKGGEYITIHIPSGTSKIRITVNKTAFKRSTISNYKVIPEDGSKPPKVRRVGRIRLPGEGPDPDSKRGKKQQKLAQEYDDYHH